MYTIYCFYAHNVLLLNTVPLILKDLKYDGKCFFVYNFYLICSLSDFQIIFGVIILYIHTDTHF